MSDKSQTVRKTVFIHEFSVKANVKHLCVLRKRYVVTDISLTKN